MKSLMTALLAAVVVVGSAQAAEDASAQFKSRCATRAQKQGLTGEALDNFVWQCVGNLRDYNNKID